MTEEIRFASPADAEELVAIYAPYVKDTVITYEYEVPSILEFKSRIETISKKYPYLVYLVDGAIVGYAYANTFRTREAFKWDVETSVYVKEEFHHKKVAYKLYTRLFTLLKEQGFYNVYAYITVPNPKSTRFHTKFGFKEVAVYKNTGYKLGKWCDLCGMAMSLQPIREASIPGETRSIRALDATFIQTTLSLDYEITEGKCL